MKRKVQEKLIEMQVKMLHHLHALKEDESGMGMVEIALIIFIIIALGVTFKTRITAFLGNIFDSLNFDTLMT